MRLNITDYNIYLIIFFLQNIAKPEMFKADLITFEKLIYTS